jgi:hypothetical protein
MHLGLKSKSFSVDCSWLWLWLWLCRWTIYGSQFAWSTINGAKEVLFMPFCMLDLMGWVGLGWSKQERISRAG